MVSENGIRVVICECSEHTDTAEKCLSILRKQYKSVDVIRTVRIQEAQSGYVFSDITEVPGEEWYRESQYDILLLLGDETSNRSQVVRFLTGFGIERNRIIPDQVMCLHGFTWEKYKNLLTSRLTILSSNCAGGILYHLFCMPFYSPMINMFLHNDSFLRLVQNPFLRFSNALVINRFEHDAVTGDYPVYDLGDVELHMNHYHDTEYAEKTWYQRLGRINPDNILYMMYTDNAEELARFHLLPYSKKVCFVPFAADLPDAFPIPPAIDREAKLWQLVLAIADGSLACYDLWDMMLEGKKTQIMEF